ncbi:hypothetical protein PH5382_02229 [Phaeobacter sp. CECT 5382]|nr:hypothetical protein PH5382_02229 [Phaeobacter sp. CECT 5382]
MARRRSPGAGAMLKIAIPAAYFNETDSRVRIIGTLCLISGAAERGETLYLQGIKAKIAQIAANSISQPLIAWPLACI